ncbi:ECF-type sigma factor [Botrimarina sp.]|uniref:ECF-type sigma factor n=1 Tax=Botrimarina sp. TaxID=2795802 RepID=UPI0032F08E55
MAPDPADGAADPADPGLITGLIGRIGRGDRAAEEELYRIVDGELRMLAHRQRNEFGDPSLTTGDIVQQLALKWTKDRRLGEMKNRRYLFCAACDQMRRILIDHWRQRKAIKHGGRVSRVELGEWADAALDSATTLFGDEIESLDEAMEVLGRERPRQQEVVSLKVFGGLTHSEVADIVGVSTDTVKRDWLTGLARLRSMLGDLE